MAKKNLITSPIGKAMWPHLTTPDTKFQPDGEYHVKLNVQQADAADLIAKIDQGMADSLVLAKERNPDTKKFKVADPPYTQEDDGSYSFSYKLKAKVTPKKGDPFMQRPALFNADATPLAADVRIGGGSAIRCSCEIIPFWTQLVGAGVTLRLRAVQIVNLVAYGAPPADYFGFAVEAEPVTETLAEVAAAVADAAVPDVSTTVPGSGTPEF